MHIFQACLGILVFLGIAYLMSSDRKNVNWALVGGGILLQFLLALLILRVEFVYTFFQGISNFFIGVADWSDYGGDFLFRSFATGGVEAPLLNFAFRILPTIIFYASLSAVLYHLGILQLIVRAFSWLMNRFMKMTGAESLSAAANVFIGQTEAPLIVKPYLEKMSKSEIMNLMVGGMATVAGGVFVVYMSFLGGDDPAQRLYWGTHLLTASLISAPAAIVLAKLLIPEDPNRNLDGTASLKGTKPHANILDAITGGATDGLKLAVNVGVMLLVFMAFIAMFNEFLGWFGSFINVNDNISQSTDGHFQGLSLQYLLGNACAPFAWLMGVESGDLLLVGQLLGEKTIINELVAYQHLGDISGAGLESSGAFQSPRSVLIATYALCGFANFASIGIQIGGISAIAPGQRKILARFGFKALIGGTLASFITACVAAIIL